MLIKYQPFVEKNLLVIQSQGDFSIEKYILINLY